MLDRAMDGKLPPLAQQPAALQLRLDRKFRCRTSFPYAVALVHSRAVHPQQVHIVAQQVRGAKMTRTMAQAARLRRLHHVGERGNLPRPEGHTQYARLHLHIARAARRLPAICCSCCPVSARVRLAHHQGEIQRSEHKVLLAVSSSSSSSSSSGSSDGSSSSSWICTKCKWAPCARAWLDVGAQLLHPEDARRRIVSGAACVWRRQALKQRKAETSGHTTGRLLRLLPALCCRWLHPPPRLLLCRHRGRCCCVTAEPRIAGG